MERRREEGLGIYEARTVLGILNVKPHVLRYWEQTLPLVRSRRDESGRRVWTSAQLRMLLRIRHLVVDRRLSPAAAGEAVLLEASGVSADAKARLEALRGKLVALLLQARRVSTVLTAPGADEVHRSTARDVRDASGRDGSARRDRLLHGTLPIAPFIDTGLVRPPTSDTVRSAVERSVAQSFRGARTADLTPSVGGGDEANGASFVRVVVGHLSATESPRTVADALARLIAHRLAETRDATPLAIPVPSDAIGAYSRAFRGRLDSGAALLVPLPHLEWRGRRWWSPRLALLAALSENPEFERWFSRTRGHVLYLWGVDDPNAPVAPPVDMVRAARRGPVGLAMGVCRRAHTVSMIDMSVIDARRRREVWNAALGCGAWSYCAARRTPGRPTPLESSTQTPDNGEWRWRYDLWLRDMVRIEPALFSVGRSSIPSPWRGDRWLCELPYVWRTPFRGE